MRHFSLSPMTALTATSAGAGDVNVQTINLPKGCSAFWLTVEGQAARMTLDGTDPATGGAASHIVPAGQLPLLVPCSSDAVIKFISGGAGSSTVQVTPFE